VKLTTEVLMAGCPAKAYVSGHIYASSGVSSRLGTNLFVLEYAAVQLVS